MFIDDVNLPVRDKFGVQRCNEVGRICMLFQAEKQNLFRVSDLFVRVTLKSKEEI